MRETREEGQIRALFHSLRAGTEVPDFGPMLDRARRGAEEARPLQLTPGRRSARWAAWASVAIAAGLAGLLLTRPVANEDEAFEQLVTAFASDAALGSWESPTAELLLVPGVELLRGTPSFGASLPGLYTQPLDPVP